jgi:hypothetical protein
MQSRVGASIVGLIGIIAASFCLASPTFAASGEISRAEAAPDWMHASIAGSVTWTGCENVLTAPQPPEGPVGEEYEAESGFPWAPESSASPTCAWRAFAALSPTADCESVARVTVWSEGERSDQGTASFDMPDVPLNGQSGQYLCLEVIEVAADGMTIPCVPPGEPVPPGWHCPYATTSFLHLLASAPLFAAGAPSADPIGMHPDQAATHPRRCRRRAKGFVSRKSGCSSHHRRRRRRDLRHRRHGRHDRALKFRSS